VSLLPCWEQAARSSARLRRRLTGSCGLNPRLDVSGLPEEEAGGL